jgi:hypothetical protein
MLPRIVSLSLWLACAGLVGALALAPAVSHAQSADKAAEKFRLTEEMKRLAQRNAWPGVEAKYEELIELDIPLEFPTHTLGAQSARNLGKTYEVYQRLMRAKEVKADPEVEQEIAAIDSRYGRVRLVGNERWEVVLTRPAMPFAPDERKSVEYASMVAMESGGFEGMLPQGSYVIGGEKAKEPIEFSVEPGPEWQEFVLTVKQSESTEGLIVYHGPMALIGANYSLSGAPSSEVTHSDGGHQAHPDDLSGTGFGLEAGYQLGFTREFGVSVSFSYHNLYTGEDQLHGYTGYLAVLATPGMARIGLGPVYGRLGGQGEGVAEWFDIDQDILAYPRENTIYDGQSWAGGLKLTASYGLLDLEPLQGVPELWAVWQTDSHRSFISFGVRVGIVPLVPRFRE